MRVMDFASFDITVMFVSRKREGGFWFHRIWTYSEDSVTKMAKEIKEGRKIGSINGAGGVLDGRWCAAGESVGATLQCCYIFEMLRLSVFPLVKPLV